MKNEIEMCDCSHVLASHDEFKYDCNECSCTYFVSNSRNKMIGYHLIKIQKGEIGASSKIQEELDELIDAEMQNCKLMQLIELSDLIGAIELYLEKNFKDIFLEDLIKMSKITRRAFENGARK